MSAVAGVLSGICIILGKVLISHPNRQLGEIADLFAALFGLFLTIGMYLWHRRESGVLGGVAFIVLLFGLSAVVSLDYLCALWRSSCLRGRSISC